MIIRPQHECGKLPRHASLSPLPNLCRACVPLAGLLVIIFTSVSADQGASCSQARAVEASTPEGRAGATG